tara:strand:+ start:955 stop:1083 length:129 start_codon:yes stop_codon:yes gene_type:complete
MPFAKEDSSWFRDTACSATIETDLERHLGNVDWNDGSAACLE